MKEDEGEGKGDDEGGDSRDRERCGKSGGNNKNVSKQEMRRAQREYWMNTRTFTSPPVCVTFG